MTTITDLQTALLDLLKEYFSGLNKMGLIRLRESPYYRSELQLDDFMLALREVFP
jgi:hypothetical protein